MRSSRLPIILPIYRDPGSSGPRGSSPGPASSPAPAPSPSPPEDSGGPGGFGDCLEALAAEQPTEYQKEQREWLGLWRPEAFDAVEWAKAFDRKKRKRTGNYEEEM